MVAKKGHRRIIEFRSFEMRDVLKYCFIESFGVYEVSALGLIIEVARVHIRELEENRGVDNSFGVVFGVDNISVFDDVAKCIQLIRRQSHFLLNERQYFVCILPVGHCVGCKELRKFLLKRLFVLNRADE